MGTHANLYLLLETSSYSEGGQVLRLRHGVISYHYLYCSLAPPTYDKWVELTYSEDSSKIISYRYLLCPLISGQSSAKVKIAVRLYFLPLSSLFTYHKWVELSYSEDSGKIISYHNLHCS